MTGTLARSNVLRFVELAGLGRAARRVVLRVEVEDVALPSIDSDDTVVPCSSYGTMRGVTHGAGEQAATSFRGDRCPH